MQRFARSVLVAAAVFYAYGAAVHVMNMLSLSGFDWSGAPRSWQVLDVVYLALDVVVAAGLVLRWRPALGAFYLAAVSQVVLYTALRGWVTDVPAPYTPGPDGLAYLDLLVGFHLVSMVVVGIAAHRYRGWRRQGV